MADLAIVVPSRGRPAQAAELLDAFEQTCTADTTIILAVGEDDPTLAEYTFLHSPRLHAVTVVPGIVRPSTMVHALNHVTSLYAPWSRAIGFMGDDHRPRTTGWDRAYLDQLDMLGTGIVYGDDLLQRMRLPTQVAMTSDIPLALGYMVPPELWHMYVDNFWLDLGKRAGCIRHLPGVVVEHMHPIAGKSEWTEGHKQVNADEIYEHDQAVYREYVKSELASAAARVGALRTSH